MRDVRAIAVKFYHVFLPHKSKTLLHDCTTPCLLAVCVGLIEALIWSCAGDLWGPLVLSVTLALFAKDFLIDFCGNC